MMGKEKAATKKAEDRIKAYVVAFLCFFLIWIPGGSRVMAAGENVQKPEEFKGSIYEEELEALVREYYDAVSAKDSGRAEVLAGTKNRQREERNEALWSAGVEAVLVTDVIVYPCGEYRIVVVSYEIKIAGVETKAPGAETFVAKKTAGDGFLLFADDMEQELSEDDREMLQNKMQEITENQDLMEFFGEINREYIEAREDPDLREWEENWLEKQSRALQEEAAKQENDTDRETGSGLQDISEGSGPPDASYVVKEGDCLWDIAGELFKDSTKWHVIYEKNKAVIGEDPDLIMPGMELELP